MKSFGHNEDFVDRVVDLCAVLQINMEKNRTLWESHDYSTKMKNEILSHNRWDYKMMLKKQIGIITASDILDTDTQ